MSRIVFSRSARRDRREIALFTAEHFGLEQARRVRDSFRRALGLLARSPSAGRRLYEFDDLGRELRACVVARRFVVIYESQVEEIRVARILHGARQVIAELERDTGDST